MGLSGEERAAIIQTGGQVGVNALNYRWNKKMNQANQDFAREMYERQRRDALADWQMQNEYNHPLEQMNRLRQAGLNPNLVYGKGADNTAAVVRSSSAPGYQGQPYRMDPSIVSGLVSNYFNIRQQKAQTDNIAANTAVAMAQRNNIESQTAKNIQETARSVFDLEQANQLKDGVIERQKLENQSLNQSININLKDYDLRKMQMDINEARLKLDKAKNEQDIRESKQRINQSVVTTLGIQLNNDYQKLRNAELFPLEKSKLEKDITLLEQTIQNAKTSGGIAELDHMLRMDGINPQDPWYLRMLMQDINKSSKHDEFMDYMNDKYERQKVYKRYNELGGYNGTGFTWEQYKKMYVK